MSKYTDEEKAVGRAFRDQAQANLLDFIDISPPTHIVPNFLSVYRHSCPANNNRSTALDLREVYQRSPASGAVPEGRFAFIY